MNVLTSTEVVSYRSGMKMGFAAGLAFSIGVSISCHAAKTCYRAGKISNHRNQRF